MKTPAHLNQSVLQAIQGALKEEKEPRARRALKIAASTLGCAAILGIPFFISFRDQLNWAWGVAWGIWFVILLASFCLYFYPQPRLTLSGTWSPHLLAKILAIATISTLLQILICPSFVFLTSSFDLNPMLPITNALMHIGGMTLCMLFCGFLFSFISSLLSLLLVGRVTRHPSFKRMLPAIALLISAQVPLLAVQALTEDLRPYVLPWAMGLVAGCLFALGLIQLGQAKSGRAQNS